MFKRLVARARAAGHRLASRSARRAGRATATACSAQLEAFAAGTGDPRLMVKPARLGCSVGMTLAHDRRRARGRRSTRRSATTTSRSSSATSRARATSRSRSSATSPTPLELYGPGEIVAGHEFYDYAAKYTPGLSRDLDHAPRSRRDPARVDAQARARRLPGDAAARASRGSTSCSRASELVICEINTIPGFTPISLFPTMPAAGGYDFAGGLPAGRRPRARAARGAASAAGSPPPTCRGDDGRSHARLPASRSDRRSAPRSPSALRPGRAARWRASGGPKPVERAVGRDPHAGPRRGARSRCSSRPAGCTARSPRDAFVAARDDGQRQRPGRSEDAIRRRARAARRPERVHARHRRRSSSGSSRSPRSPAPRSRVALPDERRRSRSPSARRCSPGRSATRRFLVDARRDAVRRARRRRAGGRGALPARRRPRAPASAALGVGRRSTRSTSTPRSGSARSRPADVGSAATRVGVRDRRRERLRAPRRPAAGTRSSASTARRCARPTSSRARSGCSGACSPATTRRTSSG